MRTAKKFCLPTEWQPFAESALSVYSLHLKARLRNLWKSTEKTTEMFQGLFKFCEKELKFLWQEQTPGGILSKTPTSHPNFLLPFYIFTMFKTVSAPCRHSSVTRLF